jgi:hypothetical protein
MGGEGDGQVVAMEDGFAAGRPFDPVLEVFGYVSFWLLEAAEADPGAIPGVKTGFVN